MPENGQQDYFESRWNMMGSELKRIADLQDELDRLVYQLKQRSNNAIEPYISALWALYIRYTGIAKNSYQKKIYEQVEKELDEAQIMVNGWITLPKSAPMKHMFQGKISEKLIGIHKSLMEFKQAVGLGIQFKFVLSDNKRMRKQAEID